MQKTNEKIYIFKNYLPTINCSTWQPLWWSWPWCLMQYYKTIKNITWPPLKWSPWWCPLIYCNTKFCGVATWRSMKVQGE